jgi:hypothetical protein
VCVWICSFCRFVIMLLCVCVCAWLLLCGLTGFDMHDTISSQLTIPLALIVSAVYVSVNCLMYVVVPLIGNFVV